MDRVMDRIMSSPWAQAALGSQTDMRGGSQLNYNEFLECLLRVGSTRIFPFLIRHVL